MITLSQKLAMALIMAVLYTCLFTAIGVISHETMIAIFGTIALGGLTSYALSQLN